jgi:hypothetical protein
VVKRSQISLQAKSRIFSVGFLENNKTFDNFLRSARTSSHLPLWSKPPPWTVWKNSEKKANELKNGDWWVSNHHFTGLITKNLWYSQLRVKLRKCACASAILRQDQPFGQPFGQRFRRAFGAYQLFGWAGGVRENTQKQFFARGTQRCTDVPSNTRTDTDTRHTLFLKTPTHSAYARLFAIVQMNPSRVQRRWITSQPPLLSTHIHKLGSCCDYLEIYTEHARKFWTFCISNCTHALATLSLSNIPLTHSQPPLDHPNYHHHWVFPVSLRRCVRSVIDVLVWNTELLLKQRGFSCFFFLRIFSRSFCTISHPNARPTGFFICSRI